MLSSEQGFRQIYIACGYTDLRHGIDGLSCIIQEQFRLSPFQKDVLFLFCGRRQDRFKGLVWEGDGFLLLYKRIEAGRLQWPRTMEEVAMISREQFESLMDGYAILQRSTIKEAPFTEIA